ncbi:MAG: hydroxymethylglutaryl-CoA synthase family protein [Spirochaetales bacterium]
MSGEQSVGISDLSLYVPRPSMNLESLLEHRIQQEPSLKRRLTRALETTGQERMRFPELWQDNSTLAAQASRDLLERAGNSSLAKMRYLSVGTETPVDHSKPVAAYVEGMLQRSGIDIPENLSTFQVQHACAGGTVAMMGVAAMLSHSSNSGESGLIVCSDIARYDAPSTAEITQGAGAVAMRVEKNPSLLTMDLGTPGYCSRDVDDFFRPLGSTTAKVKGGYSVQCYHESLDSAFLDHCARRDTAPETVLRETDMFVVHVPFYRMGITAMNNLLSKYISEDQKTIDSFLEERGFYEGLAPAKLVGNIYSGSAYMALMSQLVERYSVLGSDIVGKNILLASYGSGNTMVVLSMKVAPEAPGVIEQWDLAGTVAGGRESGMAEYEQWLEFPLDREEYARRLAAASVRHGEYYLAGIREDGYREYEYRQ